MLFEIEDNYTWKYVKTNLPTYKISKHEFWINIKVVL